MRLPRLKRRRQKFTLRSEISSFYVGHRGSRNSWDNPGYRDYDLKRLKAQRLLKPAYKTSLLGLKHNQKILAKRLLQRRYKKCWKLSRRIFQPNYTESFKLGRGHSTRIEKPKKQLF